MVRRIRAPAVVLPPPATREFPLRRALFAVVLFVLVLAGCRIETNVGIALEADGSGTASIDIGMDDEALSFVETTGQDFASACSTDGIGDLVGENPLEGVLGAGQSEATAEVVEEDGLTICRTSFAFDDVTAIADSTDTEGLALDVSITADEVSVNGVLAGEAAGGDEGLGDLGFDLSLLEDAFSVNLRIAMPGEVIESNADTTLSDGTLEWNVDLFGGGDTVIQATSDPNAGGGGGSATTLIIVLAVVALAAVAVFLFMRSRQKPAAATAGGDAAAVADAAPAGSPEPTETTEAPEGFGPEGTQE